MKTSIINGIRTTITFIAIFLILIVEGCMNWVNLEFKWENLLKIELYIITGLNSLLMVSVKIIAYNYLLPLIKDKNRNLKKEVIKNTKLNEFKDINFYPWCENEYNTHSKIEAWKISISKKLSKLNRKAKDSEIAEYYKIKKSLNNLKENEQELNIEPNFNEYGKKRELLEFQLTNEYIEDNIEYLNVKYYNINPYDFDIPVSNDKVNKNKIISHENRAIAFSLALSCIIMLGLNMLKQLLDPTPNSTAFIATIINLGIDLIFMTFQCFSAFLDANKIVKKEILVAYTNRNRILIEYIYFKNSDNVIEVKNRINKIEEDSIKESYEGA